MVLVSAAGLAAWLAPWPAPLLLAPLAPPLMWSAAALRAVPRGAVAAGLAFAVLWSAAQLLARLIDQPGAWAPAAWEAGRLGVRLLAVVGLALAIPLAATPVAVGRAAGWFLAPLERLARLVRLVRLAGPIRLVRLIRLARLARPRRAPRHPRGRSGPEAPSSGRPASRHPKGLPGGRRRPLGVWRVALAMALMMSLVPRVLALVVRLNRTMALRAPNLPARRRARLMGQTLLRVMGSRAWTAALAVAARDLYRPGPWDWPSGRSGSAGGDGGRAGLGGPPEPGADGESAGGPGPGAGGGGGR
jgi:hypothetical protein